MVFLSRSDVRGVGLFGSGERTKAEPTSIGPNAGAEARGGRSDPLEAGAVRLIDHTITGVLLDRRFTKVRAAIIKSIPILVIDQSIVRRLHNKAMQKDMPPIHNTLNIRLSFSRNFLPGVEKADLKVLLIHEDWVALSGEDHWHARHSSYDLASATTIGFSVVLSAATEPAKPARCTDFDRR